MSDEDLLRRIERVLNDVVVRLSNIEARLSNIEVKLSESKTSGGGQRKSSSGGEDKFAKKLRVQTEQLERLGDLLNDESYMKLGESLRVDMGKKGRLTKKQWGLLRFRRKEAALKVIQALVNNPATSSEHRQRLREMKAQIEQNNAASERLVDELLRIAENYVSG